MEVQVALPDSFLESVAELVAQIVAAEMDKSSDIFLDANEAAKYLGISRQRIYTLASLDRIPSRKIGSSRRFLRSELLSWADQGGQTCP